MKCKISVLSLVLVTLLSTTFAQAEGYRTFVGEGENKIPLVVLKGTPYEIGFAFGRLMKEESRKIVYGFRTVAQLAEYRAFTKEDKPSRKQRRYTDEVLDAAWEATSPYISKRFQEQMRGLADGAGLPLEMIRRTYMIPVVSDYSCSGAAIWGKASVDGHLYQFRNLDYHMQAGLQNYPVIIVYLPEQGIPHISPTFAGFLGINTGMNAKGTVLTEIGDTPSRDYPFDLNGVPFFTMFSDLLHEADSFDKAIDMIKHAKRIKKYHYVVANGPNQAGAKLKAHAPNLSIWQDNDPTDEEAPRVFEDLVYQAESRNPLAVKHIEENYGKYDAPRVIELTKKVASKDGNLLAVVYDATDLNLWVAYAKGQACAHSQTFVPVHLKDYLDYRTDGPDILDRVE